MAYFGQFSGTVASISDFTTGNEQTAGCTKMISIITGNGQPVNFVATPYTYFADNEIIKTRDEITGYFDANAPALLIYPPQYQALVIAKVSPYQNVKVDHFNANLVSSDGTLKLNLSPYTEMRLENGQVFTGNPANRNLIVFYGATTRSIPAQTTPYRIIVMCRMPG